MVTTPEGDADVRPGQDWPDAGVSVLRACPSCEYPLSQHVHSTIHYEGDALKITCVLFKSGEKLN